MSTMSKSQTSGVIFVSGGLDSDHGQTIEYLDRYVLQLVVGIDREHIFFGNFFTGLFIAVPMKVCL